MLTLLVMLVSCSSSLHAIASVKLFGMIACISSVSVARSGSIWNAWAFKKLPSQCLGFAIRASRALQIGREGAKSSHRVLFVHICILRTGSLIKVD